MVASVKLEVQNPSLSPQFRCKLQEWTAAVRYTFDADGAQQRTPYFYRYGPNGKEEREATEEEREAILAGRSQRFKPLVHIAATVAIIIVLFLAGYLIPPILWPRNEAFSAIVNGSALREIGLGNSRVPCRGPNRNLYVFGYTIHATHPGFKTNASGAACWDIFNGEWAWRIDEPYGYMNSDRSPQSRGLED